MHGSPTGNTIPAWFQVEMECLFEERLAELMSEYVDREADGTAPPVEEFLAAYPDVAAELRPLLHTSARLSRAARAIRPVGSGEAVFDKIQAKLLVGTERG